MPGCQRIPQRRYVELVANSETGNMGLKKARFCMPYRGFCLMTVPLEIAVPRQEEISGAATDRLSQTSR